MSDLRVIADDVTGACDVGSEFAAAGYAVRVAVDQSAHPARPGEIEVVNTQSRSLTSTEAAARIEAALAGRSTGVVLKKIDTALRGHLGAEIAAAVAASGARGAFVIPAIPAVGRTTRAGRQWVGGRSLSETEFARDPEGQGAESSVSAVLAHECDWPSEVVDVDTVRCGRLGDRARALFDDARRLIIVDAETDADVAQAVTSILSLPRPVCLAGSVPVASALACEGAVGHGARSASLRPTLRLPALIVCGSLHSRAHAQTGALVAADLADRELVDGRTVGALTARIRAVLDRGRSVILEARAVEGSPARAALRRVEETLGAVVQRVAAAGPIGSLVLIGGETSFAVLRRLAASELIVRGRPAPLVAIAEIDAGVCAGTLLVTKGGSGGDVEALRDLVDANTVR